MKRNYLVEGMRCAGCAKNLERTVLELPEIEEAVVNFPLRQLTATFKNLNENSSRKKRTSVQAGDSEMTDRPDLLDDSGVLKAAKALGFRLKRLDDVSGKNSLEDFNRKEQAELRFRLIFSFCFFLPLFYLTMGKMFHWPGTVYFHQPEHLLLSGYLELFLTLPILWIHRRNLLRGFLRLFRADPDMDSLIALGAVSAFGYSLFVLIQMTAVSLNEFGFLNVISFLNISGNQLSQWAMNLYFESAGGILSLIALGRYFEACSRGKTTSALSQLIRLSPDTAAVLRNGEELEIPVAMVLPGDTVLVRAGQKIPVDGKIISGNASIDESSLTGESVPVFKEIGASVFAATINTDGFLTVKTEKTGQETVLAKIIELVRNTGASKAPIARLADRVCARFVVVVIGLALLTGIVWLFVGQPFAFALSMSIAVLVVSCPCALGLATPLAMMVGTGKGALAGILVKSAEVFELLNSAKVVVLDKTGTITAGKPILERIVSCSGQNKSQLFQTANSLETGSLHPLAQGIRSGNQELLLTNNSISESDSESKSESNSELNSVSDCPERLNVVCHSNKLTADSSTTFSTCSADKLVGNSVDSSADISADNIADKSANKSTDISSDCLAMNYQMTPGEGVSGEIGGQLYFLGNERMMKAKGIDLSTEKARIQRFLAERKTVLFLADTRKLLGIFVFSDPIKQESQEAISAFKRLGLEPILLSGDHRQTVGSVAEQLGIDRFFSEVLPNEKESVIRSLQESGKKVIMIGDGINDAPALVRADVGMAVGSGTDIAMDSANLILIHGRLTDAVSAVQLGRATVRNIKENLFWAFLYNLIGIPLAAGVLYPIFGWKLSPMFAAAAMGLSSLCVVLNALRLQYVLSRRF